MKLIPQRRLFFLRAATSNANRGVGTAWQNCFRPCGWIAVILTALFLGCSSLTPERVSVLSQIAGQAAQIGASEWLAKHPEQKPSFDAVIAALIALQKAGNTNQDAWVERLSTLPIDAFRGPDGELYVSPRSKEPVPDAARVVVWDKHLNKSTTVRGTATLPVLRSALFGLRRAVGPKPPVPGKEKALSGIRPEGSLPDAVLDEQFRALTKKTNEVHEFPFLK